MATTNRLTIWIAGDVLTASDLNAEFNNVLTTLNGHVDADNIDLADSYVWTGPNQYTQTVIGTTLSSLLPGAYNLGISLSGGVLSTTTLGGSAPSVTNYNTIVIPSVTAGANVELHITAAQTIQDKNNASPQILGRWGTTASVAWGNAMPVFIGVVNKDDTATNARYFLTRDPRMTVTPSSTNNIGIAGAAPATSSQTNIVLFGTAANTGYNSKPCMILGSVTMTIDNSAGGSATIGALVAGRDGIGQWNESTKFTMVTGQNGAATGSYLQQAAPAWSTQNYFWWQRRNGDVRVEVYLSGDAGTDGSSGTAVIAATPLANVFSQDVTITLAELQYVANQTTAFVYAASGAPSLGFVKNIGTTATNSTSVLYTDFANGNRRIAFSAEFPAFTS